MAEVVLIPIADSTDGEWTPSTGTELYAVVDDAVGGGSDYAQGTSSQTDAAELLISALPSDAVEITDVLVRWEALKSVAGDDTHRLGVYVINSGGFNLAGGSASFQTLTTGRTVYTASVTPTELTNGASVPSNWTNARIIFANSFTQSMGNDGAILQVHSVEVRVTYTAIAVLEPTRPKLYGDYQSAVHRSGRW